MRRLGSARLGSARLRIFTVPIEGGGGEMKENDPGLSNSYLIDQHAARARLAVSRRVDGSRFALLDMMRKA